ncbi:MAG: PHP domain-containing protein [Bacillota bacterium]
MRPYKIDLHVHTVLSPCADLLMTPGNIIKKALKKKIDIMAITDHNSGENLPAILNMAENTSVKIIPGMEVESREEVHLLCLFPDYDFLKIWQDIVYEALPDKKNNEELFGPQIIVDKNDKYKSRLNKLLAVATNMSIKDIVDGVKHLNGLVIPSHIDKTNGLIKNLGLIPDNLNLDIMEIHKNNCIKEFVTKFTFVKNKILIKNSDSHYLDEITPGMEVNLTGKNLKAIEKGLKERKDKKFLL